MENDGFVVLLVFGAVEQGCVALADRLFQLGDLVGEELEFGEVAAAEFGPAFGVVAEPLAELGAGSDVFEPEVEVGLLFGEAAGPEAIDEDAGAVGEGGWVVHALELEGHGVGVAAG